MKRNLLLLAASVVVVVSLTNCQHKQTWSQDDRLAMRAMLDDYRQMIYLNELNDTEFTIFSGNVASKIEHRHPVYITFTQIDQMGDTVDMYVVSEVADQIRQEPMKIKHLFPRSELVRTGYMPDQTTHEARSAYYKCLGSKLSNTFDSYDQLYSLLLTENPQAWAKVHQIEKECSNEMFANSTLVELNEALEID